MGEGKASGGEDFLFWGNLSVSCTAEKSGGWIVSSLSIQ